MKIGRSEGRERGEREGEGEKGGEGVRDRGGKRTIGWERKKGRGWCRGKEGRKREGEVRGCKSTCDMEESSD